MNLLNQCQLWTDRGEDRKIVEAIEAIPEAERTPDILSELARAYNNLADGNPALYERALSLLLPLEETLKDDYRWNFRVGYAYYYLDEEGPALAHFRKALAARPGDEDAEWFVRECGQRLVAPLFERPFRTRVQDMWADFQTHEAELRALIDRSGETDAAAELLPLAASILDKAIRGAAFAAGKDGDRYVLTLSPEGHPVQLWKILYALRHAPDVLRTAWRLEAGLPRKEGELRLDGQAVSGEAVSVQWERTGRGYRFGLYAPDLAGKAPDAAQAAGALLLYQALGEIAAMRLMDGLDILSAPPEGTALPLSRLADALTEAGADLSPDGESCLAAREQTYGGHPIRDRDTDWRLDVTEGRTRCPEAVAGYLSGDDGAVDAFHRDGVAAGFFVWRPEDCPEAYRTAEDVRRALAAYVTAQAGPEAVMWTGWADGLYAGYLDCLLWDPKPALDAAEDFFRREGFRQGAFHSFRRRVPTAYFLEEEKAEPVPEPPRKTILDAAIVQQLESCVEDTSGYFGRMFHELDRYLAEGVSRGRFTMAEARADRDTALWYAYACCNMDEYEWYWRAARWMAGSEAQAGGCGTWYYRYSVALMHCGRLEEARDYAERGTREEPSYPWIWLQAAKLRSHFGDREGALAAVEQGLFLVPGDYEFQTLRSEIRRGASLEEMEYHWIDPDCDKRLQQGLDEDADGKLRALSCVTTDEDALRDILALFQMQAPDGDGLYCVSRYAVAGHPVDLVFCMNRAGLSKLKIGWLRRFKEALDSGAWLTREHEGDEGLLTAVLVGLDYTVRTRYVKSRGDEFFEGPPGSARREQADGESGTWAEILLSDGDGALDALAEALSAAGLAAERADGDTLMAEDGGVTAVFCFYDRPREGAGLPPHTAHMTAAAIGGEREARQALLRRALAACAGLRGAAGILAGGECVPPETYRGS